MKSYGSLFERVVAPANLAEAMARAARGKGDRGGVARFLRDADAELAAMRVELLDGAYRPRPFQQFGILDPKPRTISCADFRDRVVHHAVCGVVAPCIERGLIADNYACRVGKGSHRALLRAKEFALRYGWFLKSDIRRYYDSVDHGILLGKLGRLCREARLLRLFEVIVRQPLPGQAAGKGLPIGSLTSQWFANLYLDETDHWLKEVRRVPGYVRYMDDLACWSDSKQELLALAADLEAFVSERLEVHLKPERTFVGPVSEGMPFLGWRVYPRLLRQQGARLRLRRRKFAQREAQYGRGEISAAKLQDCARALNGPRVFLGFGEPLRASIEV